MMKWRNVGPVILLVVGIALLGGGKGCVPDLLDLIPSPSLVKYPNAWLVFVEESSERDLDFAVLLQNKKWVDSLKSREINWRIYDKDQADAASYVEHCKSYPWVLFVETDGTLVKSAAAPKNSKEADELIKQVTGK